MPRRKTTEEYIQECKDKGYDLPIENYINSSTEIKHKCSKGHTYFQIPNNHLKGHGCPICYGNQKKTPESYLNGCKDKGINLPVENYINDSTKINHKCSKGHVYPQRPSDNLQGIGCPICSKKKKKTAEEYIQECKEKGLDLPIEDYITNKTKINHKCKQGHIYPQKPNHHLKGIGCPVCNESHGEKFIRNYLDKNNIKYIPQKKFKDLKDKTYLSYDFYLPNCNTLIEYQGEQHYISKDYFGGDKQFKKQQLHDKLKREYAKENGYELIEISYKIDTQDKIDTYLDRIIQD